MRSCTAVTHPWLSVIYHNNKPLLVDSAAIEEAMLGPLRKLAMAQT